MPALGRMVSRSMQSLATPIDMYMKCGLVENAQEFFHGMEEKGVLSWNVLSGCS